MSADKPKKWLRAMAKLRAMHWGGGPVQAVLDAGHGWQQTSHNPSIRYLVERGMATITRERRLGRARRTILLSD